MSLKDLVARKEYYKKWVLENKEKQSTYKRNWSKKKNARLKTTVLTHYSIETPACAHCGITDIDVLTIDHINGGGTKHRRELKSWGSIYRWLVTNNFPVGFQVLCFNCNFKKHRTEKS